MYTGTLVEFLNMGGGEMMLILVAVLLLFGGKKLPELARGLGKGLRDFKDASDGVKREIHRNINAAGITDEINEFKSALNVDDDVNTKKHNYDYEPNESPYSFDDGGNSEYTGDEAAHYNASAEDAGEQAEDVKPADHNEHKEIETDKTKL